MREVIRKLQPALLIAAHELNILWLRLDGWIGRFGQASGQARVLASACWSFPIYSQTFVHQEVLALARAGFAVRFLYANLAPRSELAQACAPLWRLKRRIILHACTGARDLVRFRRERPELVDALIRDLAQATGLRPEVIETNEHFLHAFSFARAVRAWRTDYLHSYFFYEQTLFAWVASRLLGIPRGISCYADHMLDDYPLKAVGLHLKECDVVVATSRRIAAELEGIHGAPLSGLVVKPNAIDTAGFLPRVRRQRNRDEPLRLICVCRIDPKKGIEYLMAAVRLLLDQGLAIEARIIGAADGQSPQALSYAHTLRELADKLGTDSAVIFAGQRGNHEIRRELAEADVFVAPFVDLPSGDKDGIPTALLEAMAGGCAIVATDAGSIAEVIDDGVHGILVSQRDAAALAEALQRLAANEHLCQRLGSQALDRARREYNVATSEIGFHQQVRCTVRRHREQRDKVGAKT